MQKDGCAVWLCPGSVVSKQVLNTEGPGCARQWSLIIFFCLPLLLSQFDKKGWSLRWSWLGAPRAYLSLAE